MPKTEADPFEGVKADMGAPDPKVPFPLPKEPLPDPKVKGVVVVDDDDDALAAAVDPREETVAIVGFAVLVAAERLFKLGEPGARDDVGVGDCDLSAIEKKRKKSVSKGSDLEASYILSAKGAFEANDANGEGAVESNANPDVEEANAEKPPVDTLPLTLFPLLFFAEMADEPDDADATLPNVVGFDAAGNGLFIDKRSAA
jgi:hypothetical protein